MQILVLALVSLSLILNQVYVFAKLFLTLTLKQTFAIHVQHLLNLLSVSVIFVNFLFQWGFSDAFIHLICQMQIQTVAVKQDTFFLKI